jgi:hypothetical protein
VRDGFRTCLMIFRIVAGVVTRVVTGGDEVYKHHSSARVVTRGVCAHLNARGPLLSSRCGKNPTSPWWASLESANLALARVYGFLPRANEEPASSMERRGRRTGAARWDGSSLSPRNLTLLEGAADSTEEDGWGCGRGASSLQNLPLESRAIRATETRLRQRRGRRKPEKGIEGGRQGGAFIKKVRMRK